VTGEINFGEGKGNIYSAGAEILACRDKEVQLAARCYFGGRTVYVSGLPYSAENTRLLHRAILWACQRDGHLRDWYSENPDTELHVYPAAGQYCVANNTLEPRETVVFADGKRFPLTLAAGAIAWYGFSR